MNSYNQIKISYSVINTIICLFLFFNSKETFACSNWWGWGVNSVDLLPTPFLGICMGNDTASFDATAGLLPGGMAGWAKTDIGLNIGLFHTDRYHYSFSLKYARSLLGGSGERFIWDDISSLFRWKNKESKTSYAIGYAHEYADTGESGHVNSGMLIYSVGFDFW